MVVAGNRETSFFLPRLLDFSRLVTIEEIDGQPQNGGPYA
jgi:hypothetical protein